MSDLKRTKRVRTSSEEMTMEEHISSKRKEFVDARMESPLLRERADGMRKDSSLLEGRHNKRRRLDMLQRATEIEEEAEERESMRREHFFEQTVVMYMKRYNGKRGGVDPSSTCKKKESTEAYVRQRDCTINHRSAIFDEYLAEMDNAPPKVAMAVRDECPSCVPVSKLLLCSSKAILSCPLCGYCVTFLDATSSSTLFDEVIEFSQYSYKRVNHYMMWLTLVQGKEAHRVPEDILETVMQDLFERERVAKSSDITQKMVRDSLRRLRLRRAYDHVTQITSRISGVRPPRIPPKTEDKLKNMFLQMQPAFHRHAPKTRTNFLSYSYILYRCFQILGLDHMLEGLSLLKGRDKLEANDAIFKNMCEDLKWPIFDLPS